MISIINYEANYYFINFYIKINEECIIQIMYLCSDIHHMRCH